MPKWKKGATEFTVSVNYHEVRGYQSSIPKPVMEALGGPESITFRVKGDKVMVLSSERKKSKRELNPN